MDLYIFFLLSFCIGCNSPFAPNRAHIMPRYRLMKWTTTAARLEKSRTCLTGKMCFMCWSSISRCCVGKRFFSHLLCGDRVWFFISRRCCHMKRPNITFNNNKWIKISFDTVFAMIITIDASPNSKFSFTDKFHVTHRHHHPQIAASRICAWKMMWIIILNKAYRNWTQCDACRMRN